MIIIGADYHASFQEVAFMEFKLEMRGKTNFVAFSPSRRQKYGEYSSPRIVRPFVMDPLVTRNTQGHQIIDGVMSETTPCLDVMDLKVLHSSTLLTTPAVAF